ncbi:MAG: phenylalanine--tRNA ligase subunit alpha [bacterium]
MIGILRDVQALAASYQTMISDIQTPAELDQLRSQLLGKTSVVAKALGSLKSIPIEQKRELGAAANQLSRQIESALAAQQAIVSQAKDDDLPPIDFSQPIQSVHQAGHMHPTQVVLSEVYDIFTRLGFAVVDGPEIETDWYNFEVLNMPADHPAREMQDTFYIESDEGHPPLVPRTHTSASQIRYMEEHEPPFKVIVPGKVYRNEDEDRTHMWSFYQVEGLVVGEGVSMADLKGTLLHVMKELFGDSTKIRFRPSFFPYTEPSVEVDVWYQDEWLEICGAGMVHADVLERGGIDSERFTGFAFGFGPDRLTMIRYGLKDIRILWRPNMLVSKQA